MLHFDHAMQNAFNMISATCIYEYHTISNNDTGHSKILNKS